VISIYSNNYSTDHYIQQLKFQQQYRVYHSVDQYVAATADVKIAFVNHLNSYEPPESEQQRLQQVIGGHKFSQEIDQVKQCSDLVFAFDNEIHPYHKQLFKQHCQPNVHWAIPAHVNNLCVDKKNVILWNFFLHSTKMFYSNILFKLEELNHNSTKPLYFDALLGRPRSHRDFLYQKIKDNNLQNKIKLTYLNPDLNDDSIKFEWDLNISKSEIEHIKHPVSTMRKVSYYGQQQPLSRIIPIDMYNQTAYSIISETGFDNFYSFYTEKTAKALLAKRLFVMFSGYKFLENLQQIGFQTFSNVIDESYDQIPDNQQRWLAAFEQVKKLCNMDQHEVFEKISPAVEHNYSLLMNTDWDQHMINQVQQKINDYTTIQLHTHQ
jgi:hypothetical protein